MWQIIKMSILVDKRATNKNCLPIVMEKYSKKGY